MDLSGQIGTPLSACARDRIPRAKELRLSRLSAFSLPAPPTSDGFCVLPKWPRGDQPDIGHVATRLEPLLARKRPWKSPFSTV